MRTRIDRFVSKMRLTSRLLLAEALRVETIKLLLMNMYCLKSQFLLI